MATSITQTVPQPHDQHSRPGGRRRPFSTWMKKLANFKNSSSSGEGSHHGHGHSRRILYQMKTQGKRSKNNNPYPQSGRIGTSHAHNSLPSFSTSPSGITSSATSVELSSSARSSADGGPPPTAGARSTIAPTVCTDHEASHSIMAPSHGAASTIGTRTCGGVDSRRGGDSTFSSPAPSVRSLTTTLTTIQSLAHDDNAAGNGNGNTNAASNHPHQGNTIQFSQPFPTTSMSPASAIPVHLAPHPTTYSTATANNLLTDNASILTLASSSKRRRRRSFDTDASVRALAPSSLWGGSRESLPLSVLSSNIDGNMPPTPSLHNSRMADRTSIYSATGIAPALSSERNSFYAKQSIAGGAGDAASVRSGFLGHMRADSTAGSVAGLNSPLASPREANVPERDEVEYNIKGKEMDKETE